jgi:UDP-GlcNAc:undecaprenyl-phosphate GlcNAc-1-phosphate transferase
LGWLDALRLPWVADALAAFALASGGGLLLALALTPFFRAAARRLGVIDRPDGRRKLHAEAVPRLGGPAVLLAAAGAVALARALAPDTGWWSPAEVDAALHLLVATAGIAAVGLFDDVRGARAWVKLLAQVAAGLYLFNHGYDVRLVSNPFGEPFLLGWMSLPLTVLWVVGVSNAINLVDGLDGLAAGVGISAATVVFTFAVLNERWEIALMAAALAGALVGFLRYNFSPASVFLGDAGSLSVGLVLAALSLRGSMKGSMAVTVVAPLLALGFPLVDTSMALLRRLLGGRSILEADADHIHHRMLRMGMTPRQAVFLLYGFTALFSAMALLAATGHTETVSVAVVAFSAVTWMGIRRLAPATPPPATGVAGAPAPSAEPG